MAKVRADSATMVLDDPPSNKKAKKKAREILQDFLADMEDHPDAKLVTVNSEAPRESQMWLDTPRRDQQVMVIRVLIRNR